MKHTAFFLLLMLLAVSAAAQQSAEPQATDPLPEFLKISRIESITADVRDAASNRNISFTVPRSNWEAILDSLQPAKRDTAQAPGKVLGSLKIRYSDLPSQVSIELFYVPQAPGCFAIQENGGHLRYYRGGDSEKLNAALLKARPSEK